jgi:hypothetical protein
VRASTISIAITLTLAPLSALTFDQDEFCAAVTDIAQRSNARKGRWLDRSTRHDGVELDCESMTLEVKRYLNADPDEMRQGWEARKQRQWNARYCNDDARREAIDNGRSIISTLTFRSGESSCRLSPSAAEQIPTSPLKSPRPREARYSKVLCAGGSCLAAGCALPQGIHAYGYTGPSVRGRGLGIF